MKHDPKCVLCEVALDLFGVDAACGGVKERNNMHSSVARANCPSGGCHGIICDSQLNPVKDHSLAVGVPHKLSYPYLQPKLTLVV